MAEKVIGRRLHIYINGKEVERTLTNLRKAHVKAKAQMNRATIGTDEWKKAAKQVKRLGKEVDLANKDQKEFTESLALTNKQLKDQKTEVGNTSEAFQKFTSSFSDLFQGIKSGDFLQVQSGLKGIKAGLFGATKAALAFIATPLGAFIAVAVGIAAATKAFFDYNTAISKSVKLTQQLTGFEGDKLKEFRASVQATASVFDKDFNDVIKSANALAKQMKIPFDEALSLINQGFVRGADSSGDFLKKLEEYPIQFKNAGYSAQDFIDIATQEVKGGVYDDKLVDALKEADIALKEFTGATKDALVNAFGSDFSTGIQKGLATGELTTKMAINKIIAQADKMGLNFQQKQELISSVFKGAGEDAGGFAEIVIQLNEAFDDENKKLSEVEEANLRLVESTTDYEKAVADLFDKSQSGFPVMLSNLKAIGKEIMTDILVGMKRMFTSVEMLKKQAGFEGQNEAVKRMSENMKLFGTTAEEEAKHQINTTIKNIHRLEKEVEEAGFFSKTKKKELLANQKGYLQELILIAKNESQLFLDFEKNLKTDKTTHNSEGDKTKEENEADAKVAAKHKKAQLLKEKLFKKTEAELTKYIAKQTAERELINKTALDKQLASIDNKYAKEIEKAQGHDEQLKALELLRYQEKADAKLAAEEALKLRLTELNEANELEEEALRLEKEALAATTEEDRIQLLLDRTRYIANQQLDIEEKKELARLKLIHATEAEIAAIKKKFALQKSKVEDTFNKGKKAADEVAQKNEAVINKRRTAEFSNMFGNIAQLLGKHTKAGKAAAIAQATINTYQGITEVWTAKSVLPEPFATASKVLSTATVLASGLGAMRNIASTKTPSFARGGYTGIGSLGLGSNLGGEIRGVVEEDEYVIPKFVRNDPEVAPVLEYLEAKRTGNVSSFANGIDTSVETTSYSDTSSNQTSEMLLDVILELKEQLSQGIKSYNVRDHADFLNRKEIDEEHQELLKQIE